MNNLSTKSGCSNPPNLHTTALLDSAANVTLLSAQASADDAPVQLPNKTIIQPAGERMFTTKTLRLLLNKLPISAREAHCAPGIVNNIIFVSDLCDAGCEVYFHHTGCEITFNGETIIRGWRNLRTNMWRISLLSDGGNNIIPNDDDSITEDVLMPKNVANSIYECDNTNQLIQFYHATMGHPVTSTWCKAIDAGYF